MNKAIIIDACIFIGLGALLFSAPYLTDEYIHGVLWMSGHIMGDKIIKNTQAVVNDYSGNITAITNYNPISTWMPFGRLVKVPNAVFAHNSTTDILVEWNDTFIVDCFGGTTFLGNSTAMWYRPINTTMAYSQN